MIKGTVFNVQRFSVHDGPGIRTNVFLKGCPLRCLWCHNPEGLSREVDMEFIPNKCIGCGRCTVCPNGCHVITDEGLHGFDRTNCVKCGKCVDACVASALQRAGKEMTSEEVLKEVMLDEMFYKESGGGITLSGGEPLSQIDFAEEILMLSKEKGLHTAIETCGFYKAEILDRVLPYVDLFLYDYKVTGREEHKAATGVYPDLILDNLARINEAGRDVVLRCPIIPGINDNEIHFDAIASLADKYEHVIRVDLEPYHELGNSKYQNIGKEYSYSGEVPKADRMEEIRAHIDSLTSKKVVIS